MSEALRQALLKRKRKKEALAKEAAEKLLDSSSSSSSSSSSTSPSPKKRLKTVRSQEEKEKKIQEEKQKKKEKEKENKEIREIHLKARARTKIFDALCGKKEGEEEGGGAEEERAREIVEEVLKKNKGEFDRSFSSHIIRLSFNISHQDNHVLKTKILNGEIPPEKLVEYTNQDLAPPSMKKKTEAAQQNMTQSIIVNPEDYGTTLAFKNCKYCQSANVVSLTSSSTADVRKAEIWGSKNELEQKKEYFCPDCRAKWTEME